MTSDTIRKFFDPNLPPFQPRPEDTALVYLAAAVAEVAAQLAEINERERL